MSSYFSLHECSMLTFMKSKETNSYEDMTSTGINVRNGMVVDEIVIHPC